MTFSHTGCSRQNKKRKGNAGDTQETDTQQEEREQGESRLEGEEKTPGEEAPQKRGAEQKTAAGDTEGPAKTIQVARKAEPGTASKPELEAEFDYEKGEAKLSVDGTTMYSKAFQQQSPHKGDGSAVLASFEGVEEGVRVKTLWWGMLQSLEERPAAPSFRLWKPKRKIPIAPIHRQMTSRAKKWLLSQTKKTV